MSLSFLLAILLIGHTNVVYLSADPELSDAQIAGAVWDVPAASESMPDIEVEASVESEQLSASDRPSGIRTSFPFHTVCCWRIRRV